jgi:cytochrome c oxidase assembly protein subunit 15
MVVLTSPRWRTALPDLAAGHCLPAEKTRTIGKSSLRRASSGTREFQRLALVVAVLVYVQIVLGAQLRHRLPGAALYWFQLWVWLHLLNGALLSGLLVVLIRASGRQGQPMLRRRVWLAALLDLVQLVLGVFTWITHYGLPGWFRDYISMIDYTVVTKGRLQAIVTTGHVAAGSLALVAALSVAMWSRRLLAEKA